MLSNNFLSKVNSIYEVTEDNQYKDFKKCLLLGKEKSLL